VTRQKLVSSIARACAALLAAVLFVRCFHPLDGAGVGLDSAWSIGLAEAAAKHLAFGRDVAFTFGPLGYLVVGVALPANASERVAYQAAIALLIAVLAAWEFLAARTIFQKVAFAALVLILAELWRDETELTMLALLLLWTIPPFRGRAVAPPWAFALGAFSGLVSLTKFTVGIEAFAGGLVIFAAKVVATRRDAGTRATNLRALFAFAVAFGALSLSIPASASYGVLVAGVLGAIAFLTSLWYAAAGGAASRRSFVIGAAAVLALGMSNSALGYVVTSEELSSGYSAAMSIIGPPWHVNVALTLAAISLFLLIGNRESFTPGVAFALALSLFLSFKEGFVRQDGHVLAFFTASVAIATLAVAVASSARLAGAALLAGLISLLVTQAASAGFGYPPEPIFAALDPRTAIAETFKAIAPQPDAADLDNRFVAGLAGDVLPAETVRGLARGSVDVRPWESSIVFVNGLTWQPEPVFQSYAAYDVALDQLNASSVIGHGADHILFSWQSIDGRGPLWDTPAALRELICRYRLDERFAQPASTEDGLPLLVLAKSPARCGEPMDARSASVRWGDPLPIPSVPGALTFAAIDIRYSPLGRLLDEVFRVPPIYLKVADASGRDEYLRLVGEVAADGIIISPLPRDLAGFASLLQGRIAHVPSGTMTLETDSPWYFEPNPKVRFETIAYK
jgi:hypothetical protein